jgi:hypothetical protein
MEKKLPLMLDRRPKKKTEVMARNLSYLTMLFCLAGLIGCGDDDSIVIPTPTPAETLTVSFQDGNLPNPSYSGTRDAVLKDGPTNDFRNGNFGAAPFDTVGFMSLGGATYERRFIIKMDLSSLTDCSRVLAAGLTIRIIPPVPDEISLEAHRVNLLDWKTWVEGSGGIFAGVSWTTLDGTAPWDGEGGDYDIPAFDQETVSNDSTVTFPLPTTLVRTWIKQPATNEGVIITRSETPGAQSLILFMRESDQAAWRPRIDVTYIKGG